MEEWFTRTLQSLVDEGLEAAALVDRHGKVIAIAGELDRDEAMPLAALVMYRLKSKDLAARLFAGEVISLDLDDRRVAVGVAKRQLFVVAVLGAAPLDLAYELRDRVANMLADAGGDLEPPPPTRSGGDGGSGPAELQLVELGITIPRAKA